MSTWHYKTLGGRCFLNTSLKSLKTSRKTDRYLISVETLESCRDLNIYNSKILSVNNKIVLTTLFQIKK